jgi:cell division septal protein FtsQ
VSTQAPARRRPPRKAIDPRIRERRVAVLRAQGRRRLRWLIGVFVVGVLAAAAWLVTHSTLLDVEHVRVLGAQHATAAEVRRAAGVERGDAIVFVDTGAVEHDVEQVAWVDRARVKRSLSGEVAIRVTERRPAAWARRAPDRVALVDTSGRVLTDAAEPPAELAEIVGLDEVPAAGRAIEPVAAAGVLRKVPPELGLRTARVAVQEGTVAITLREGTEVRLGSPDRLAAKGRAALAVLRATPGLPPGYVDVRVPNAPVTG